MMRESLVLVAGFAVLAWVAGWAVDAAYFEPARTMDSQVAALSSELDGLRVRERRARAELAGTAGDTSPSIAAAVDAAPNAAVSAERLQELVRNTVASFGGQPISSQSGVTELGGGYARTSLLLRARFDETGLLAFLRQIEGLTPVVLVESLEVQQLPIANDAMTLDVTANLVGIHADVAAD